MPTRYSNHAAGNRRLDAQFPNPRSTMVMAGPGTRGTLYAWFALSGFAGLIYESVWSHYLKLFLGHAAYAQTLVLETFMGGMALGAWQAGDWSRRLANPLRAYAIVEGLLGALALLFDPLFRAL